MKRLRKFLAFSLISFLIAIILSSFFDIKLVMILFFTSVLVIGYFNYKEKVGRRILIALFFAFAVTSYYTYEYTTTNIMIGKINLFPLIAWTFGLVVLGEIYSKIKLKYKWLKLCLIYIILLMFVEYVGYNFLNIKLNSNFPGLFGLELMHSPIGLKLFYLLEKTRRIRECENLFHPNFFCSIKTRLYEFCANPISCIAFCDSKGAYLSER